MNWELRGRHFSIDEDLTGHTGRHLETELGRFAHRIDRVRVQMDDLNGPRGGVDTQCRIVADLKPYGQLIVEHVASNPFAAVSEAAERLRCRLQRHLDRRRDAHRPRVA